MRKLFVSINHISVTTDLWKNRSDTHFLCLTAHFLDNKYNLVSVIIGFRRFKQRHTAINIKAFIEKEFDNLGIKDKVKYIVSDNGSDIKKATSNMSNNCKRFSCLAHNLNLAIKNGLLLWNKIGYA